MCENFIYKAALKALTKFSTQSVWILEMTIELGHLFEKSRLVVHFGVSAGQCISVGVKVQTVIKLLNNVSVNKAAKVELFSTILRTLASAKFDEKFLSETEGIFLKLPS